jgi:hypothetical protein
MEQKKESNLFAGINLLNEMVLDKAHQMLKTSLEDDKHRLQEIINRGKPEHFTDEQWEMSLKTGEKILKMLNHG